MPSPTTLRTAFAPFERPDEPVHYAMPSVGDVFIRDLDDEFYVARVVGLVQSRGVWSAEISTGSADICQPRRISEGDTWQDKAHWRPVPAQEPVQALRVLEERVRVLSTYCTELASRLAALEKDSVPPLTVPVVENGKGRDRGAGARTAG